MTIEELITEESPGRGEKFSRERLKRLLAELRVTQPLVLELSLPSIQEVTFMKVGSEFYLSATGLVAGRLGESTVTVSL